MKKLAILTLYGYYNYGNKYQNYAVQETLKRYGYDVHTLVVYPDRKQMIRPAFFLLKAISGNTAIKRYLKIYRFSKRYIPIRAVYKKDLQIPPEISDEYDCFAVGSDQVWNPNIKPDERQNFFLSFADRNKRVCVSPSFGVSEIPEKYRSIYTEGLNGFEYLCSREEAGVKIIEELTGKKAEHLIDPTLALTKNEWQKIFSDSKTPGEKYILSALLGKLSQDEEAYINNLADKNGLKIINVFASDSFYGPDEVLSLINNASLVFTDSFHFTAFSVNFGIPFIVTERKDDSVNSAMFSRISSLLGMLSLEERQYGKTKPGEELKCNFDNAQKILERERKKYFEFLDRSLNRNEG